MATIGYDYGADMLNAMGIDSQDVVGFDLHVHADDVVHLTLVRNLREDELTGLVGFLRRLFGRTTKTEKVVPGMGG